MDYSTNEIGAMTPRVWKIVMETSVMELSLLAAVRRGVWGKCALIALLALAIVACGGGNDRQEKYLQKAQQLFDVENYDKARIEVKNVLQINPKNNDARQLLGEIYLQRGDLRKAYGMFLSIIDSEADHLGANAALAEIFVVVRAFDRAIEHANKVLVVDAANVEVMGYKAVALAGQKQMEAAKQMALAALAIDSGDPAAIGILVQDHFNREQLEQALALVEQGLAVNEGEIRLIRMKIALLDNMGRKEQVEREVKILTARFPDNESYVNTLTQYYVKESRFDDAEAVLQSFIENNPELLEAKLKMVAFLMQYQNKERAIARVNSYLKADPEQGKFYLALAQLHLFTGDQGEAIAVLNRAIDRDPRSVAAIEARNLLVGIALKAEDLAAAHDMLAEVLDIEPENQAALLVRARLSLSDGMLKAGMADLRAVLKNDPESIEAIKLLAGAQEVAGNEDLALDNYKKLISLQEPELQTLASVARLSIKLQQYQGAENYIRQALELDTDNAGLVTDLIRLLVIKEDWDSAIAFAQRLIDSEGSRALGLFLRAGLHLQLEEFDAALPKLQQSLALQPSSIETLTTIARVLYQKHSAEIAIQYVGKHCRAHAKQAGCRHVLGSLYAQNKQYAEAAEALEAALSLDDSAVVSYRQLARVHAASGDPTAVAAVLQRGISRTSDVDLSFQLATLHYQQLAYQKAADLYVAMIDQDDRLLAAKNNLAMLYAENLNTPDNLKAARALIADLQDSDNPAYLDTVGWVLYHSGDYDRSVTYLQAAVDKLGSSELLQYHLGMAFYRLNDEMKAKQHLQLAVANDELQYSGRDIAEATLAELQ